MTLFLDSVFASQGFILSGLSIHFFIFPARGPGTPRVPVMLDQSNMPPGKEQGPKTNSPAIHGEIPLKSFWGYSGVLGGCIICSVGTLEFFFETKSKVGSTRLWNTSLNFNQQAI